MNNKGEKPWFVDLNQPQAASQDDAPEPDQNQDAASDPEPSDASDDTQENALPEDTLGLALSGGGIRSAAFSMGVIQALARSKWLKHVDILSTVSGGGYTGAFLGRFFDQTRAGDGLRGPDGVDPATAQAHVMEELQDPRSQPNAWIRKHANYLAPNGFGDQLVNFVTYWRNLCSLLLILAFFFLAVFGIAAGITYSSLFAALINNIYVLSNAISPISNAAPEWLSPFWLRIAELSLWVGIVPLAFAYWLGSQDRIFSFVVTYLLALLTLTIGLLFALGQPVSLIVFMAAVGWTVVSWYVIRRDEGLGNPKSPWRLALGRNLLTNWLAKAFAVTAVLISLAVIDSVGIWLARAVVLGEFNFATILTAIGSLAGIIGLGTPILRTLAWYLASEGSENSGILSILLRIPYLPSLLVLLLGVFIPLILISFVVHLSYNGGYTYIAGLLATVVAVVITLLLGSRESFPFVNRSGPLQIYGSRLARVFLGAVNPQRLRHLDGMNVAHVIEGDDTPFHQYKPHEAGGPLHILNVAVNETVDSASERDVSARQSQNLAVGPVGMSIAKEWHAVWKSDNPAQPPELRPLVDHVSVHPLSSRDGQPAAVESMTLRQWMAISGAAFSPGQGRNTSLVRALIMTMANVRLGYWWDSKLGIMKLANAPFRLGLRKKLSAWVAGWFQGQSLLLAELKGRFSGPWQRYWYLSDGGHFEYSGAYELLRRRVPFIIVCDAGADKAKSGEIMADLTRIARIDWGAEISDIASPHDSDCKSEDEEKATLDYLDSLGVPKHVACKLGRLRDLLTDHESGKTKHHASLLQVSYLGDEDADAWHGRKHSWILYLKASINGDESVDVLTYQAEHPKFPNQSTLDQFFDEEQFESYRKLGEHVGSEVFVES